MKNTFRRTLSLLLVITLLFGLTINASAASKTTVVDGIEILVVKDNSKVRIVQTEDENSVYTVTYDKKEESTQVTITDKFTEESKIGKAVKSSEISGKVVDKMETKGIKYDQAVEELEADALVMSTSVATTNENTFCNFEYTKYRYSTYTNWELRRPAPGFNSTYYFQRIQDSGNQVLIEKYQDEVEVINVLEWSYISALGLSGLLSFIAGVASAGAVLSGGVLTPAAWTAIAAAAGATGTTVGIAIAIGESMEKAYELYYDVYYS